MPLFHEGVTPQEGASLAATRQKHAELVDRRQVLQWYSNGEVTLPPGITEQAMQAEQKQTGVQFANARSVALSRVGGMIWGYGLGDCRSLMHCFPERQWLRACISGK
jgi:hypothetical protein